jgi:aspartate carbamoyltransferase catalytic subunit
MKSFLGRDILSLKEFERDDYYRIFEVCDRLAPLARDRKNGDLCRDKTLLTAFYQPSTRTRMATEAAMHRLGGHVLGFSDAKMTRAGDFYQESIKDTVHMLEYYADVIYMEPVVQADYTKSRVDAAEAEQGLTPAAYKVTRELLRERAKPGAIILHSLPRMDELPPDVDATRHARYWIEAFNGVVLRMALIALVLGRTE